MPSKPIAVLSSDWHLLPAAWKKYPAIRGDAYYSLQQIVDLAVSLEVPLVAAGDLFDNKTPDSLSVSICLHEMRKLASAGQKVYFIQGQHELSDPPWMTLFDNAVNIHSFDSYGAVSPIEINGLRCCAMDIAKPSYFVACLESAHAYAQNHGTFDLFITHQVWKDFTINTSSEFSLDAVKFCKILYTGDYHRYVDSNFGKVRVLSTGSTCMQSHDENPRKFVIILNDDLSITKYSLKTRPCFSESIEDHESLQRFLDRNLQVVLDNWPIKDLPEVITKPLIKIKYNRNLPNCHSLLTDKLGDWVYELVSTDFDHERMVSDPNGRGEMAAIDIAECVSKFTDDPNTYKDVIRVYGSENVSLELTSMKEEHLAIEGKD